jgi:hypothetical protein
MAAFFRRLGLIAICFWAGCAYAGVIAGVGVPTVERLRAKAIEHISAPLVSDLNVGCYLGRCSR